LPGAVADSLPRLPSDGHDEELKVDSSAPFIDDLVAAPPLSVRGWRRMTLSDAVRARYHDLTMRETLLLEADSRCRESREGSSRAGSTTCTAARLAARLEKNLGSVSRWVTTAAERRSSD
jgi:hypothetical protein